EQLEPAARPLGVGRDPDQGAEAAGVTEGHPVQVRADRPVVAVYDVADVADHAVHRGQVQVTPQRDHGTAVSGETAAHLDRGARARIHARPSPPRLTVAGKRLAEAARHAPSL